MTRYQYLTSMKGIPETGEPTKEQWLEFFNEHIPQLLKGYTLFPTKAERTKLIKDGYLHEPNEVDAKHPYVNPTEKAERETIAIRHKNFRNSSGTLGSLLIVGNSYYDAKYYIYGYVDGCFYPFLYRLYPPKR